MILCRFEFILLVAFFRHDGSFRSRIFGRKGNHNYNSKFQGWQSLSFKCKWINNWVFASILQFLVPWSWGRNCLSLLFLLELRKLVHSTEKGRKNTDDNEIIASSSVLWPASSAINSAFLYMCIYVQVFSRANTFRKSVNTLLSELFLKCEWYFLVWYWTFQAWNSN